jgi:hypothetical protein
LVPAKKKRESQQRYRCVDLKMNADGAAAALSSSNNNLWAPKERLSVPNQLSAINARNEAEKKDRFYKEATVDYVRQEGNAHKQVRYVCPLCVLNGKNEMAHAIHFSLDFYRDPSDQNYDPDYDPMLERGSKFYFHNDQFRLPIPSRKMKNANDEKIRKVALGKRTKLRAHMRDVHGEGVMPFALTLESDYEPISEELTAIFCRMKDVPMVSAEEDPVAYKELKQKVANWRSTEKLKRDPNGEAAKTRRESKTKTMRKLRAKVAAKKLVVK